MPNDDQIERIANKASSGEEQRPEFQVPEISLHGTEGVFQRTTFTDDGEREKESIGETIEFIALRQRKSLFSYESDDLIYWSDEYNHNDQKVRLWKKEMDVVTVVDQGYAPELREEYNLSGSTQEHSYGLYDGELHQLTIKGSSLGPWWDHLTEIRDEDLHPFLVKTSVGTREESNGAITYHVMTFDFEEHDADLDEIEEKIDYLNDKFDAIDEYNKNQMEKDEELDEEELVEELPDDMNVEEEHEGEKIDYPDDEDIAPEDIPF